MAGIVLSEQETAVLIAWNRTMATLTEREVDKESYTRRALDIAVTLYDAQHQVRSVTAKEFATMVDAALAKINEADLAIVI